MTDPGEPTDAPLWAQGDLMFRVAGAGGAPDRLVKVRRPFALVGRAPDADIVIDDRAASGRHAYLHLDPRGVYAVDLVTRTGTRINGADRPVGWLRPGDRLEIAGRAIELLRLRIDGQVIDPPPRDDDLLADTQRDDLHGITLEPLRPGESPWILGSELVFLGWSASCGIQIKDASIARTHCALLRTPRGAFLIDLCGRQTWVEDHLVRGAAPLRDGDLLTLGATQFTARVTPPSAHPRASSPPSRSREPADATTMLPAVLPGTSLPPNVVPLPPTLTDILPFEAQGAFLAWIFNAIQGSHGEVMRRQGEFQLAMTQALRQIQHDQATLLTAQLERIESIDRELAAIRAEIERRGATPPTPTTPPPPNVEPLRIARPNPDATNHNPGPETRATTTWLLDRVNQLENENRSAWKDLLSRLSQPRKPT